MKTVEEARAEILDWVKPSGLDDLRPMIDALIRAVRHETFMLCHDALNAAALSTHETVGELADALRKAREEDG